MKNLPLTLMYVLVIMFGVYSCTQNENVTVEPEVNRFDLISPDGFTLAESDAVLKSMIQKELIPVYGKDYEFEITSVTYTQVPGKLTYADIRYSTPDDHQRNFIFYWNKDDVPEEGGQRVATDDEPRPAPPCGGECVDGGTDCTAAYLPDEDAWSCDCNGSGGNNCKLTYGGVILTCAGKCFEDNGDPSEGTNGTQEECEPVINRKGKPKLRCLCDDSGNHGTCTPSIGPNPV